MQRITPEQVSSPFCLSSCFELQSMFTFAGTPLNIQENNLSRKMLYIKYVSLKSPSFSGVSITWKQIGVCNAWVLKSAVPQHKNAGYGTFV